MLLGNRWGYVPRLRLKPQSSPRLAPCCRVACTQHSLVTTEPVISNGLLPLLGGVRAHESSLSSAIVLEDEKDGASA